MTCDYVKRQDIFRVIWVKKGAVPKNGQSYKGAQES